MSAVFEPIQSRPAPVRTEGFVPWIRSNLFGDLRSSAVTLVIIALAAYVLPDLVKWAVLNAVVVTNAETCQAARGTGACWGVVVEKFRLIIFGRYPYEAQWRPEVATILWAKSNRTLRSSSWRKWSPTIRHRRRRPSIRIPPC